MRVLTSYWWNLKRLFPDGPPPGVAIIQVSRSHRGYPAKHIIYNWHTIAPTPEESENWKHGSGKMYAKRLQWLFKNCDNFLPLLKQFEDRYHTVILACLCRENCHRRLVWEMAFRAVIDFDYNWSWNLGAELEGPNGGRAKL